MLQEVSYYADSNLMTHHHFIGKIALYAQISFSHNYCYNYVAMIIFVPAGPNKFLPLCITLMGTLIFL